MKKKKALQKLFAFMAHLHDHGASLAVTLDADDDPVVTFRSYDGERFINITIELASLYACRGYTFHVHMRYELGSDVRDDAEERVEHGTDLYDLLRDLRIHYLLEFDPTHPAVQDDEEDGDDCF